jgi:hypothetical protein
MNDQVLELICKLANKLREYEHEPANRGDTDEGISNPAAPGYVGNFEYFTVLSVALFGITQEAAFAYALLAHICQFIPVTAVGLFFALRNGFEPEGKQERTQRFASTE